MSASEPYDRAATQLAEPAWIGRVIDDRYRIVSVLGEGGMGAVYVAEHVKLGKSVALKVIRPELAGIGEVAARFAREAMAVARFEHPHVASAIDYGTLPEGGAYLVMQLVRGRSLAALLAEEGALPWRRMCDIGAQAADALAAAKAQGIIHRDLKPDNMIIEQRDDGSDLVRILDFGIARITARDGSEPEAAPLARELTRVGTVVGTPGYMAPEQAVGDVVDHRVDLYALGVVLWEGLTGRDLWEGPDLTSIVTRQLSETPPPVRAWLREQTGRDEIPAELDKLISSLLSRQAAARPDSPGEVRDALRGMAFGAVSAGSALQIPNLRQALAWRRGLQVPAWFEPVQAWLRTRWSRLDAFRRVQVSMALLVGFAALVGWISASDTTGGKKGRTRARTSTVQAVAPASAAAAEKPGVIATGIAQLRQLVVEPPVPQELEPQAEKLIESRRRVDRRKAGEAILAYEPQAEVPVYLRRIARFEVSRTCASRNEIIDEIIDAKDPRALPSLRRLHEAPTKGCGFLNTQDCYACLRSRLAVAVQVLEPLANAKDK